MNLDRMTLLAVLLMALATVLTRTAGLLLVGRFRPTGRGKAAFDAIPPAILTAVIAPAVLTNGPADAIAGLVTAFAAFRLPLLGTVLVGVAAIVALRGIIGA